jgi:Plasmid encoded RepA protein
MQKRASENGVQEMLMADVHQLILTHGVERAKELAEDKATRLRIEAASKVMADEEHRIGITHAGFAMTSLPHRSVTDKVWVREAPGVKLLVESGHDGDGKPVGLPYGSVARLILLYLQTQAIRTNSCEVELGRSMHEWLKAMGIDPGGTGYKAVREQSRRLSLCRLTFRRPLEGATLVSNAGFVQDAIIPDEQDGWEPRLWQEVVRLDPRFYKSLREHPLPLREAALKEIAGRSMAIDAYVWLAYRLHALSGPTSVTWVALHGQFGAGFNLARQFKAKFREPLALALAAYPEAKVDVGEQVVVLHPSPAPVPEDRASGVVPLNSRRWK